MTYKKKNIVKIDDRQYRLNNIIKVQKAMVQKNLDFYKPISYQGRISDFIISVSSQKFNELKNFDFYSFKKLIFITKKKVSMNKRFTL